MHLGPRRPNRKPVLHLLDEDGRLVAVAKVAVDDLTARLVRTEFAALQRLANNLVSGVGVPAPLHLSEWLGFPVAVQAPLSLRHARTKPTLAGVLPAIRWITRGGRSGRTVCVETPWWGGLRDRVEQAPAGKLGDWLRSSQALAASGLASTELTVGAWHGDLTPWNVAMRGGRALIWDWERYALDVPTGFDVLHYDLQPRVHGRADIGQAVSSTMVRAPQLLSALGVPPDEARMVMVCYALELATRYITEGHVVNAQAARLITALLLTVDSHLGGAHASRTTPSAPRRLT